MNLVNTNQNDNEIEPFSPRADNTVRTQTLSGFGRFLWILTIFIFGIIPIIYHIYQSNKFKRQQMEINESASLIDVYLKNRRDTLTKLIDGTSSYMNYEKELLTNVTQLRNMAIDGKNRNAADATLNSAFGRLLAVAENYPQLKADSLFKESMSQATYIEQEIAASRRAYNSKVTQFNSELFVFPSSVIAGWDNLSTYNLFVTSAADREDVSFKI